MNELELIKKYDCLKKAIEELELNIKVDASEKNLKEKEQLSVELKHLAELLKNCDNSIFKLKISALISVYTEIIKALKYNVNGLRLSLNQGMMFRNYLFFKLIQEINYAFCTETGGYSIPSLLYQVDSTFEHEELKKLITEIRDEFNATQITDYPSLYDFNKKSIDKILELSSKY